MEAEDDEEIDDTYCKYCGNPTNDSDYCSIECQQDHRQEMEESDYEYK